VNAEKIVIASPPAHDSWDGLSIRPTCSNSKGKSEENAKSFCMTDCESVLRVERREGGKRQAALGTMNRPAHC
jgi:hypothetical protein